MRELNIAWAAGFFDGEGTVHLAPHLWRGQTLRYPRTVYRHVRVVAAQKTREPLERLKELFGGQIHRDYNAWKWAATGYAAKLALECMLPHLTVKRARADAALRWMRTLRHNGQPLSEEQVAERFACLKIFGERYAVAS